MYELSYGKFFVDQIYDWLVVKPLEFVVVDLQWDRSLVDRWGGEFRVAPCRRSFGAGLRSLQNGVVQFYAMAMILGILVLIGTLIPWAPK